MTRREIIAAWNAQADDMNSWHHLGEDEKLEWAMKLEREACAKVCTELAGKIWQHKELFLWECCEPKTVAENVCTNLEDTIRARGQA
jgi:hypothetical protein